MKKQTKFLSTFANIKIRPVVSEEKDKYLSIASLEKLKKFLPDINTEDNIDLLPIAFDACVVNRVNKNGDVIDGETAAKITKNFVNKPINVEHNRNQVIGCILSASFSKFGSNESLSSEEVKSMKQPFNITLGGVIWKVVNKEIAEQIEESNDPTSSNYMAISASWELGFNEYNIVVLNENEKNIEDGQFITDEKEIQKLENSLRSFGGSGKISNDKFIYRQVLGKVVPLGVGLTLNPAADVQGIATKTEEKDLGVQENKSSVEPLNENNISQEADLNVKLERIYMKITKIEDITDVLLKEVTASSVIDFISEEIKKVSDQFVAEKAEKENALKVATEKFDSTFAEQEVLKKQLEEVNQKLSLIQAEQEAKAKQEAFDIRMASFDEDFDLSDEDRQVLATDIKDLNDEAFSAYKNKMAILMKEKNKAAKKAKMDKEDIKDKGIDESKEDKNGKIIKASTISEEVKASEEVTQVPTTQEVVEQAVDNGTKASVEIPNSSPATEQSVQEKYAKAFSLEGFDIKNK
jgi:hypothetical protein